MYNIENINTPQHVRLFVQSVQQPILVQSVEEIEHCLLVLVLQDTMKTQSHKIVQVSFYINIYIINVKAVTFSACNVPVSPIVHPVEETEQVYHAHAQTDITKMEHHIPAHVKLYIYIVRKHKACPISCLKCTSATNCSKCKGDRFGTVCTCPDGLYDDNTS